MSKIYHRKIRGAKNKGENQGESFLAGMSRGKSRSSERGGGRVTRTGIPIGLEGGGTHRGKKKEKEKKTNPMTILGRGTYENTRLQPRGIAGLKTVTEKFIRSKTSLSCPPGTGKNGMGEKGELQETIQNGT